MTTTKQEKLIITTETFQRTTVRWRRNQILTWCDRCAAQVLMLTPNEATALAHTTARDIFRRVEAGGLHFIEAANGELLICRASLELTQPKA